MNIRSIMFLVIFLLAISLVSAISNVQHSVNGDQVIFTYEGDAPFWINIRGNEDIGSGGGYVWAKTNDNPFVIDLSFANNPSGLFYYGIKDSNWSQTNSFSLGEAEPKINSEDFEIIETKIKVYGENQQPLENAKVMVLHEKYKYMFPFDETGRVTHGLTDNNGGYTIKTIPGDYSMFLWKYDDVQSKSYIAFLEGIQFGKGDISVNINDVKEYSFTDLGSITDYQIVWSSEKYATQMRSLDSTELGHFSSSNIQVYTNNELSDMAFIFSGFDSVNYDKYYVSFNQDQNNVSFSELNDVYIKTNNTDTSIEEAIHYNTVGDYAWFNDMSIIRNNVQHIYTNIDKIRIYYGIRKGDTSLEIIKKGSNVINTNEFDGREINFGTTFTYDFNAVPESHNNNDIIENRTSIFNTVKDEFGNFVSGTNLEGPYMFVEIYDLNDNLLNSYNIKQFWTHWYVQDEDNRGVHYYDKDQHKIRIKLDLIDFGSEEIYTMLNDSQLYFEPSWYETDQMEFKMVPMFEDENLMFIDSISQLTDVGISQYGVPPENPCGKIQFALHWGWDKPACRSVTGLMAGPEYIGVTLLDPFSLWVASHELGHAFTINFCFPRNFECDGKGPEPTGWAEAIATSFGTGARIELYGNQGDDRGEFNGLIRHIFGELEFEQDPTDILQSIHYLIWEEYGYATIVTLIQEWDVSLRPKRIILDNNGFSVDEVIAIILSDITGDNLGWLFDVGGFDVTSERVEQGLALI